MNLYRSISNLSKFERCLWGASVFMVVASAALSDKTDWLSLFGSLIGVTALIFVAKGDVLGQVLTVAFSLFYAVVSFTFSYYGEMATYLLMTMPIALLSVVSWIRNPYGEEKSQVKVNYLSAGQIRLLFLLGGIVTVLFYFILKSFHTNNLFFSTLSVLTSFLASSLMFKRSPFYALAYASNDVVLIILWILASMEDMKYLPMVVCFLVFLINDLYGYVNWIRMGKQQNLTFS